MSTAPWQLLPPLSKDEYAALKANVAERGMLVPPIIDADSGEIIDGHHRVRAWSELRAQGVKVPDYPRDVRSFRSDDERIACVAATNLFRRHLTRLQRAEVVARLRALGWSLRRIGEVVGVDDKTVRNDLDTIADLSAIHLPERIERRGGGTYPARRPNVIVTGERDTARARHALQLLGDDAPGKLLDVRRAEELARTANLSRLRAESQASAGSLVRAEAWELRCGDFREVLGDVAAGSVDAIVCDPPYPDEFTPLWSDLGALGAHVLKPGRLLVAYSGHLRQLETMERLSEHLCFVWVGATVQRGRHTIMRRQHIWTRHRPWLIFSAGAYEARGWIDDTVESEGRGDKALTDHHWQQGLGPFRKIVSMVSQPGELILDPFTGGGTTGVACLLEGRRFLGAEIDPGAFSMSQSRFETADSEMP